MTYECFEVSVTDHIAHITLNRPEKRNSMIPSFWSELPRAIRELDSSGNIRVIVISSTGPHFTAGLDLTALAWEADDPDISKEHIEATKGLKFYENVLNMQDTFNILEECRIPVLAAIQGGCIGGGVDMVTACDMRYMSADGYFCVQEINIGITADVGTFPRLLNVLPEGMVRELCYTGRKMPAAEALERGLVNTVYADQDAMLEAVMETAREIAAKSPLAIRGTKRIINYARDHNTADTLDYIAIWNASNLHHNEIMESINAAKNKQQGDFASLPPTQKQYEN